ncbi:N-acetylmuramoyl-L-alanine amidase [Candidatus Aenigmatarchaeota archaeon]
MRAGLKVAIILLGALALGAAAYKKGPSVYRDLYHKFHSSMVHLDPSFSLREREETKYGVLHKTQCSLGTALKSLDSKDKNIHYVIDEYGHVYPIVPNSCVANHTGYAMWNGDIDRMRSLNRLTVGIEFVGENGHSLTERQYETGRELIDRLGQAYDIPDSCWLSHHRIGFSPSTNRRGRTEDWKSMTDGERSRLGLHDRWDDDPDVRDGRLSPIDE